MTVVTKRVDCTLAVPALFYIYPQAESICQNNKNEVNMMASDEFRPDVGKKIFLPHRAELEQGLRQVAYALGRDSEFKDTADFFQSFIRGFWDPYEEVCRKGNQQQKETTAEICTLETQILQALSPSERPLFERYDDLLAERNSTALDYAFLVGYQCAFRFLMMGLLPSTGTFLSGKPRK